MTTRVFVYEGQQYADPNPQLSNEQVRDMLARTFGALAGGQIDVKKDGEQEVITFSPRPQRKGSENPVYTFGYTGHKLEDLRAHIERTGAMVVDVRYNANSANPVWRKESLRKNLPEGRYVHLPALGNMNYKTEGGSIKIADMNIGIALLKVPMARMPVILMCACADYAYCHRRLIAEELLNRKLVTVIVNLD